MRIDIKFLFLLVIFQILQSCAFSPKNNHLAEEKIEGRFSLSFLEHNQSTQGRFMWKISNKNNIKTEEFYFMDPWGKTRGILMRNSEKITGSWMLLNPDHQLIDKKYLEDWLKKEFKLPSIKISSLISPITLASKKIKKYFQKKNKQSIITVTSNTNLGKITMKLLPDN